jgi:hypothetical protein
MILFPAIWFELRTDELKYLSKNLDKIKNAGKRQKYFGDCGDSLNNG